MGDSEIIAAGNPDNGAKIFKQRCSQCHTTESVSEGVCAACVRVPGISIWNADSFLVLLGWKAQDWSQFEWTIWKENWTG